MSRPLKPLFHKVLGVFAFREISLNNQDKEGTAFEGAVVGSERGCSGGSQGTVLRNA